MFGNRYFASRYFPDRYFPPGGTGTPAVVLLGGGAYVHPYVRYKEKERLERQIAAKEREADLERAKLAALTAKERENEDLARQLERLEAATREEINRLTMMKAQLIRRIDDEEAALVLLLTLPFSS